MTASAPKFSLVLATLGRSTELLRFFESLQMQTDQSYQLIIIDQNSDDRVAEQLRRVSLGGEVVHLRSRAGLSLARNVGLEAVTGEIIAFPDDDCWYPPGVLAQVRSLLDERPELDGVTGCSIDDDGSVAAGFARTAGRLDDSDVWSKAISYTIFLRAKVCQAVGHFDEQLGVGAGTVYGSGEETDYLIRAIHHGFELRYFPKLRIFHPNKEIALDAASWQKAYNYGAGMGRVLAKHEYPILFKARAVTRPVAGSAVAACLLNFGLARLRWSRARGRLFGLMPHE